MSRSRGSTSSSAHRGRARRLHLGLLAAVAVLVGSISSARPSDVDSLGNRQLAAIGLVDVTAAPFNADATGKRDGTDALQRAIDFARDHQMVTFFPPGTYTVSDTLRCIHGRHDPVTLEVRTKSRDVPCVLVGSRIGKTRPRIVLAPGSPGFNDPARPKYVIHFWARGLGEAPPEEPQPNISMNQMLIGIDVTIAPGNAGAVGVRHRAAQGSGVQDSTIDATHGYCGLEGGAGSGGSHANVTVIGGRIGVDLRQTQPASTITGFTLIGQTETALLCAGRQAVCAVGLRIEMEGPGPAIVTRPGWAAHHGQLCLVDSSIDFSRSGGNTAIDAESSLYLENVYVRGAGTLIRQTGKPETTAAAQGWTHVSQYAAGVPEKYRARKYENRVFEYPAPIFVDGKRWEEPVLAHVEPGAAPPADLVSRHLWEDDFPGWQSPGAVSVKSPPYSAAGDGETDDAAAIQRAVDEHEIVFLPKGRYAVSRTIHLRPETKLIGAFRCYTWLVPLGTEDGEFLDGDAPRPVLDTADDPDARTIVALLGIEVSHEAPGAYCLRWRCGRHSIFRATNTVVRTPWGRRGESAPLVNHPVVLVTGHGGGKWYNFHQESYRRQGPDYRHLLVEGTAEPLHFYQCNPEHARSDSNMELRRARFVSIYGLKGEYNRPILTIRDCDHVRLFGYGGNAAASEGHALFVVERTPNFLLANLVDSPRMPQGIPDTFFAGDGVDPRRWHMVEEHAREGPIVRTEPLDRPVLYQRGRAQAGPKPPR